MTFQDIYIRALKCPPGGFAHSSEFRRSPFGCPKCGSPCWTRIRRRTGTAIGATCGKCSWLTTYIVKPPAPPKPKQFELPD